MSNPNEAREAFRAAMHAAGVGNPGAILADGKLHRFKTGDDRKPNSWYILFPGPPAAGSFGCWKRGITDNWCQKPDGTRTPEEWQQIREVWRRNDEERQQVESKLHTRAQKTAAWILNRARPVANHPYLDKKRVKPIAGLREFRSRLVLPLRNADNVLLTLQFIAADGEKRFLRGGQCAGAFLGLGDKFDGPLVVCEGYATGASIHEATGFTVVCAMNCGNLRAVAEALRSKWPERDIVIAADNDQWTRNNPGLTKATEAAKNVRAKIAVPQFTDITSKPTDFNDLHQLASLNEVKTQIEAACFPKETDEEAIARLAALPLLELERCREAEAKRLKLRVTVLDKLVTSEQSKKLRTNAPDHEVDSKVEPWPDPVDGPQLLNELQCEFRRFIRLPEHAGGVLALWALHTYCFGLFQFTPYLNVMSPAKRCGKSKLLEVLACLCRAALPSANMSAAVMFRLIEDRRPTLLLDEWDSKDIDAIRAATSILNSGSKYDGKAYRCVGDEQEPRGFSTFCPKVICGIGKLSDTTADRCIVISLKRKLPHEKVERFRRYDATDLRRRCCRWAKDHSEELAAARPLLPEELDDRAQDIWEPLLAIADLAGEGWPAAARAAALALSGTSSESDGLGTQILNDIRATFTEADADRITSKALCEALAGIEGRPWAEYGKANKPITPNQLAKLLHRFTIKSRNIRSEGNTVPKGYYLADFADAFARYLPVAGDSSRYSATAIDDQAVRSVSESLPNPNGSGSLPSQPLETEFGSGVAAENEGDAQECFEALHG